MKITIDASYSVHSSTDVDIPIENVREIKDYFIIDNVLHYTLKNEKWEKVALSEKGEEEYEKSSEVKFYGAESHQTVMKLSKSL